MPAGLRAPVLPSATAQVQDLRVTLTAKFKTEEDMAMYLEACLEEAGDDASFIAAALGDIARAKGMSELARDTGLGRESLYKSLSSDGNPSFATILKVMSALGLRLHASTAHS